MPNITGIDIASATVQISEVFPGSQRDALNVKLTEVGARKMENLTRARKNQPLAVLIDGQLRAAPHVFSVISRDAQISGVFTVAEAAALIEKGGDR